MLNAKVISYRFCASFLLLPSLAFAAVDPQAPAEKKIPVVQVKTIAMSENSETLVYPARIEPKISATLLAEVEGTILSVPALGAKVKRGQAVFKIQQLDPVYQYAAARITAPVSGVISEIAVNQGTQVSRGQKLGSVVDPTQLRVSVEVPEGDLAKIAKCGKIEFQSSFLEKNEELTLEGLSPLVSTLTGTATANLVFKNKTLALSAGSLGQVVIAMKGAPAIKIPEQSIVYRGADPYVRLVEGNVAKYKPVVLGHRSAGFVEIKKGLSQNDLLIERSSMFVQDGKPVQVEKN